MTNDQEDILEKLLCFIVIQDLKTKLPNQVETGCSPLLLTRKKKKVAKVNKVYFFYSKQVNYRQRASTFFFKK